jgi:hypothetical protein
LCVGLIASLHIAVAIWIFVQAKSMRYLLIVTLVRTLKAWWI